MADRPDLPVVLCVDDEQQNLDFLHRSLRQEYEVKLTTSPEEAVTILRTSRVDVVLADYIMPKMSGVDVLERAAEYAPHAARVLISGMADAKALADAINRAAVRHFIQKPFSVQQVREIVRGAVPQNRPAQAQVVVAAAEQSARSALMDVLASHGYSGRDAGDAQGAVTAVEDPATDALLMDMDLGTETATQLLTAARKHRPPVPVVVVAENSRLDEALALVRLGAHDVVLRPFRVEELALRLARATERRRMYSEVVELKRHLAESFSYRELVGRSEKMREIYDLIERIADTESTVLIHGETGTGKELVARMLHQASRRRSAAFVAVNCAAIPEGLIESELFGHEKGAFTGAVGKKIGKFEQASSGTLFLDEVGDMPSVVQVKLLRVLQEREIERVGGSAPIKVDVRLITATHVDLEERVKDGGFRQDLFYRLNVVPLELPPLRDRRDDVRVLAGHFLDVVEKKMGKQDITFARDAVVALESYQWPGNVRELMNVIERAVALTPSGGVIGTAQLAFLGGAPLALPEQPLAETKAAPGGNGSALQLGEGGIKEAVEKLERQLIAAALKESGGNQTKAAKSLGITRQALAQKLAKYGMDQ